MEGLMPRKLRTFHGLGKSVIASGLSQNSGTTTTHAAVRPGRCGIANRMQKFNTDITAISQKLLGFKHEVGSADFGEG
ncbi:hypothetical protein TWF481_002573 [Arthrobotrys musiformis]|uniref:Uncharacterized protein n=1 Tax=Arthrobotrys musiformis TaxID=47236 RepID=A0AAV9VSR7_9PEZI